MSNENATEKEIFIENSFEDFNFGELEEKLQEQLEKETSDLDFLEKEKMGNPENLGNIIKDVVWEQFINQIAVTAGEDFITENNGLTLDLSDEAHILTAENFEYGKIPTHNSNKKIYQKRYDDYRADLQTDPNKEIKITKKMRYNEKTKTYERYDEKEKVYKEKIRYNEEIKVWEEKDTRSDKWIKKLDPDAREKFDTRNKNQKGTVAVAKDHTVSVAEQIRDTEAAAYVDRETRKDFAKSEVNLNDLDSSANSSKSDSTMSEWLDNPRKDGRTQSEYFGLDEEELRKQDKVAREEYEKMKTEGKKKIIAEGKKSQKEEAFRIGGKALRAAIMSLLAELVKEIGKKLVKWFKSGKRELSTLKESFKEAISSFIGKIKQHLINAGNTISTTIMTAIIGPIFGTLKKIWMILKQAGKSVKDAILYVRKPENRKKSLSVLILEVSKIVLAGAIGISAIVLSEVIEKSLMVIPIFAVEIPLIGSLANILGIFFGAVVSGIAGAIIINFITKIVSKKHDAEITEKQIDKGNKILSLQEEVINLKENELKHQKEKKDMEIKKRHEEADEYIKQVLIKFSEEENLSEEDDSNEIDYSDNQDDFNEIDKMLKDFKF